MHPPLLWDGCTAPRPALTMIHKGICYMYIVTYITIHTMYYWAHQGGCWVLSHTDLPIPEDLLLGEFLASLIFCICVMHLEPKGWKLKVFKEGSAEDILWRSYPVPVGRSYWACCSTAGHSQKGNSIYLKWRLSCGEFWMLIVSLGCRSDDCCPDNMQTKNMN